MKAIASVIVMALVAFPAWAGPGKAGLWEVTMKMNSTKAGAQIPPEQLEKMNQTGTDRSAWRTRPRQAFPQSEKMKQTGPDLPSVKRVTNKVCLTPQMAASNEAPTPMQERDGCQMKYPKRDGSVITADMVCNGNMKGTGKLKVAFDTDASFRGMIDFNGMSPQSGAVEMHNAFSGTWISNSCGSVKPLATK